MVNVNVVVTLARTASQRHKPGSAGTESVVHVSPYRKCDFIIGRFAFLSPLWSFGATYDVRLRLFGKSVVDFLLVLIELFARCYR